jgi:peptide deformylase
MKSIVHVPNDVLCNPTKTVTFFDKKLEKLIADMTETLVKTKNPKGVGLAAPQIGESWRIFVAKPTEKSEVRVFINPEIIKINPAKLQIDNEKKDDRLEGCLSIPAVWGKVNRSADLTLKYQDMSGVTHEEVFTGFLATIIQHEIDHLQGVLFTQRVLEQKGKIYQSTRDKKGKEVLEEIVI